MSDSERSSWDTPDIDVIRRVEGRNKAIKKLTYFLQISWEAAGLDWGAVQDSEVEDIVDSLVDAAS